MLIYKFFHGIEHFTVHKLLNFIYYRTYTVAYVFPKASVFLDTVNYHLDNFLQFGLITKWNNQMDFIYHLNNGITLQNLVSSSNKIILTLEHLLLPFGILGCGICFAFIIFLFELMISIKFR